MIHAVVCDDYEPILKLITVVLNGMGITVTGVQDGNQALDLVRELRPDLIICDIDLPGLDGISVLRELQMDDTALGSIPIILMSSVDRKREALEAGCHCFLTKPFSIDDVQDTVRRVLHIT